MTFEEECKDCYCPEDWRRAGIIADTPLWLRRWFVYEYKQKIKDSLQRRIDRQDKNSEADMELRGLKKELGL